MHFAKTTETKGKSPKMIKTKKNKKNNKKNKQEKKQHIKMKKGKESQRHSRLEDMTFHQETSAGPYQLEHVRT